MSNTIIEHEDKEKAVVMSHGPMTSYDGRIGKWSVWGILDYLHGMNIWLSENVTVDIRSQAELAERLKDEVTGVMIKMVLKVNDAAYYYSGALNTPIKYMTNLEDVRPSSVAGREMLVDAANNVVLAERLIKSCLFNTTTRRLVQYPDWFLARYNHLKGKGKFPELAKQSIPAAPPKCYSYKTKIRYSDTDYIGHTNNVIYVKICMDCVTDAASNGYLNLFTGDMCSYPVKMIEMNFIKETIPGDEIAVSMWQDDDQLYKIYFLLMTTRNIVLFSVFTFSMDKLPIVSKM